MKKTKFLVLPLLLCSWGFSASMYADNSILELKSDNSEYYDYHNSKFYFLRGEVATGFNISKSEVLYDFGGEVGEFGFDLSFVYEPGSETSSPITKDTDENRLIATGFDLRFWQGVIGVDPGLLNPKALNVPLRDVPIIVNSITGERSKLEPITADNFKANPTLSSPSEQITIADWYSARAYAFVRCTASGKSRVVLRFSKLIPNGLYTVWGLFGIDANSDGIRDAFRPLPFGGVPSAFAADERGYASYVRTLPYCPTTDDDILSVLATYHADGMTSGGVVPVFPTLGDSFLGNVAAPVHMTFNFGGLERADNKKTK